MRRGQEEGGSGSAEGGEREWREREWGEGGERERRA